MTESTHPDPNPTPDRGVEPDPHLKAAAVEPAAHSTDKNPKPDRGVKPDPR